MHHLGLVLGAVLMAFPTAAVSAEAIHINLLNYARFDAPTLERAVETVRRIFARAGIDSDVCEAFPTRVNSGCPQEAFRMIFLPREMRERLNLPKSEALGMALMTRDGHEGDTAYIFTDRVERLAEADVSGKKQTLAMLLGHVIAHETGHLLLGAGNHRLRSIMTPIWGVNELQDVLQGAMLFCPEHADRIRETLRERTSDADGGS